MHASAPRRDIDIEHLSTRMGAGNIFVKITASSFAKDISVVCWGTNGYGSRRSAPQITQVVSDALQLVRTQLHLINEYYVVSRFRLI